MMTTFSASAVAPTRSTLGESPLWVAGTGLYWIDVDSQVLHLWGSDGSVRSVGLSDTVTAIELATGPQLLAVTRHGFGWLDPTSGTVTDVVTVLDDVTLTLNDAAIDPRGRCWTGVATFDHTARGRLYCLDAGRVSVHLGSIAMSNGIDWSPSGERMYHVDSLAGTITAWRYDIVTGLLDDPATLVTIPRSVGLPDGLTVDAAGDVWVAVWGAGEIWRVDPTSGRTTATIAVPAPNATSCVVAGDDGTTLFVTTAADDENSAGGGLLYAVEVPVAGLPARRYRAPCGAL